MRCKSPRGSCPGLKLAAAPPTVTDFTLALALRRRVRVRPDPLPMFVALIVATPLSERSACWTFALTSNELICQITLAGGACAAACIARHSMSASKRSVFIVTDSATKGTKQICALCASLWLVANKLVNVAQHQEQRREAIEWQCVWSV